MDKKHLIFVVFASVTLNSVLQSSATFDGFSDETIIVLNNISYNYFEALNDVSHGLATIIDLLERLTVQIIIDNQSPSYHSIIDELNRGFLQVETAMDTTFESALLAVRSCDAIRNGRNASVPNLLEAFSEIINAVNWAYSGRSLEYPNDIDEYRNATQVAFKLVVENLFDSIGSCLSETSNQARLLIQAIEIAILKRFNNIVNIVMDAVEIYGLTVAGVQYNETDLACFSINRRLAILDVVQTIQYVFSLYDTIYIDSCLYGTDVFDKIFVIRLSQRESTYGLADTTKIVFVSIIDNWNKLSDSDTFADNGAGDIFLYNTNPAGASAADEYAYEKFLDSVAFTQSSVSANVTAVRASSRLAAAELVRKYYTGISVAINETLTCPSNELVIQELADSENLKSASVVANVFSLINNNASIAAQIETRMAELQQRALDGAIRGNSLIFRAIKILAKVNSVVDVVTRDVFTLIYALRQLAIEAFANYNKFIYYASLIVVLASNGY